MMKKTILIKLCWLLLCIVAFVTVIELSKSGQFFDFKKNTISNTIENTSKPNKQTTSSSSPSRQKSLPTQAIDQLTQEQAVVEYLDKNKRLPPFYMTKSEARSQGWNDRAGNLCDVLPGKAIGGDRFSNRERLLPEKKGRTWYEADINYRCGYRGADRILYSNDGLIYRTTDHYKSVYQLR